MGKEVSGGSLTKSTHKTPCSLCISSGNFSGGRSFWMGCPGRKKRERIIWNTSKDGLFV
jgi:hypothetical protein